MKDGFLKFKVFPTEKMPRCAMESNIYLHFGINSWYIYIGKMFPYMEHIWVRDFPSGNPSGNPDFAAPVGISTEALLQAAASGSAVAALPVASWLSKVNFESSSDSKKEGSLSHGS